MVLRIFKIQNECHQWFSGSFRVHQIRFQPDPTGELIALPQTLAGLRGPPSKIMGRRREMEGKVKRREGQGTKGPAPHSQIP